MALSRIWTVSKIWNHCQAGAGVDDPVAYVQRFDLINEVQERLASFLYALVNSFYLTGVIVQEDVTGLYSATGTGTWTAATNTLAFTLNGDIASTDVGKVIIFRVSGNIYIGSIASFVNVTTVTVSGTNLPSTNQTVDYCMIATSTLSASVINLATLKIMRSGEQVRLELESSGTTQVRLMKSLEEFRRWSTTSSDNKNVIAWCLSGDQILLAKGSGLSSYGTMTLRYPRVPTPVSADTDYVDLPDGTLTSLAITMIKSLLVQRYGNLGGMDFRGEIQTAIERVYKSFGQSISAEELKEKVEGLV